MNLQTKILKPKPRSDKLAGQGLVEFALTIPILLLIVLGVIEGGRLLYLVSAVNAAAREAARWGAASEHFTDCTGIVAAATRIGSIAGINASHLSISYDQGPGTTAVTGCPPGTGVGLGDRIVVGVTLNYNPIVPLVQFDNVPINAESARTIIHDLEITKQPDPAETEPPLIASTFDLYNLTISQKWLDTTHDKWQVEAEVTVHKDDGNPLMSVYVVGAWTGIPSASSGASCTTGPDGTCTLKSEVIPSNRSGTMIVTVTDLVDTLNEASYYDHALFSASTTKDIIGPPP